METILPLLESTWKAASEVRRMSAEAKERLLLRLADKIMSEEDRIILENKKDLDLMDKSDPKYDRLLLNAERIRGLAEALRQVAVLEDPAGKVLLEKTLKNGLVLEKKAVPLGVVGVIYESRPNVTVDVVSLCLRSGNACVLKGGKEAFYSNTCLVGLIHEVLRNEGVSEEVVLLLPTDRRYLQELLTADRFVDIIIPRGSEALIQYVRQYSRIPTIETGAGVCHTYVEQSADLVQAADIIINARVSRPSVCNSLDCVLADEAILPELIRLLVPGLEKWGVEVYADEISFDAFHKAGYARCFPARPEDFGKEWLDLKLTFRTVKDPAEALEHIRTYSSRHSEAILTRDVVLAELFLSEVDAAAVYHNASTRFTDGGEFGLGAEIGISTQKLHARGPFALEKLVTEKWIVRGEGQTRW